MNDANKDPNIIYSDIIDLPHHQATDRNHMSLYDRAAQFAPFAALVGYDEMVNEEARLTDSRAELHEDDWIFLERKINHIADAVSNNEYPEITVEYFVPDVRKQGGKYIEHTGKVKKVDSIENKILFFADNGISNGKEILIKYTRNIHGELTDNMDNSVE